MINKSVYYTVGDEPTGRITNGVTVTDTNTYYSRPWHGDNGEHMHVVATGTMAGTFTLWVTSKPDPVLSTDVDWVQDGAFSPTNPSGSDVKFQASTAIKSRWKRLRYVNASGDGVVSAWVTTPDTTTL